MRWFVRTLIGAAGCAAFCGCSAPTPAPQAISMPSIILPKTVEAPDSLEATRLGLIGDSDLLHVGDSLEQVEKLFPTPTGAVSVKELPAAFGPQYEAQGYDTVGKSLGAIMFEDKLALAMIYRSGVKAGEFATIVKSYQDRFGPPSQKVGQGSITYSFWETGNQRLMVCVAIDEKNQLRNLTISIGHQTMMDSLRMGERYAINDVRNAERLPDEKRSGE
ncbi:MAG: hypothetical protein ABL949_12675 [Fimbriimonadaceae bacterium]